MRRNLSHKVSRRKVTLLLASLMLAPLSTAAFAAGFKVDVNSTTTRNDLNSHNMDNWTVPEGPESSQKFGGVTVTLRARGGSLQGSMWKGGIDTGALMVTDGTINYDGGIDMVISGLAPGKHNVVTYHNLLSLGDQGRYTISVDDKQMLTGIEATHRVLNDDDAATGYVEFEAAAGKDVVISIKADKEGAVILNGFGVDIGNPLRQAKKPVPANNDEHAPEDVVLKWRASQTALSHDLYLGTNYDAVANATHNSPEFKGNLKAAEFPTKDLDSWQNYYWRADEVNSDSPAPVKGEVWRFVPRHLAFPEAEGYGRFAIGGRGGAVMIVTNLDDYRPGQPPIPGSLREAVNTLGPRIITFAVGGTIKLQAPLVVQHPYCTIAGQTAPGDGILLAGHTVAAGSTHDVIMRYLRIRVGDLGGTQDGCGVANCDNCIVDHCSISWSIDEAFSSRSARNITLQHTIISEALNMSVHAGYIGTGKGHSFAGSISGDIGSFHHNLVVNCAGRNWSLAGGLYQSAEFAGRLDIRNNIVYNWRHRTTDGGVKELDYVGNYYIPGPATMDRTLPEKPFLVLLDPDAGIHPNTPDDFQRYYMAGNSMEGHPEFDADNWKGTLLRTEDKGGPGTGASLQRITIDHPMFESYVKTDTPLEAYKSVVADVGANIPHSDPVDRRALDDVTHRTFHFVGSKTGYKGIIDSQTDVGSWPAMKGGDAPKDSDHDGIPDDWELAHGLNPNDPTDATKKSTGGYSNIELYINSLKPDPEPPATKAN